jgi:hypothetical protein
MFNVTKDFGSVETRSWFEWRNGVAIGMSRSVTRAQDGNIEEYETGARMVVS